MSQTYECGACEGRHDNFASDAAHGLCPKCRDKAFEDTRSSGRCCRCGEFVRALTSYGSEERDRDRFLSCPKCGLVLTRLAADHVRWINAENSRSA